MKSEPKVEQNTNIKEDLTIQERINIINQMINKITPDRTMSQIQVEEKQEKKNSSNVLEDVYKERISQSEVPKMKMEYDEIGKTINFGNTQISRNKCYRNKWKIKW